MIFFSSLNIIVHSVLIIFVMISSKLFIFEYCGIVVMSFILECRMYTKHIATTTATTSATTGM